MGVQRGINRGLPADGKGFASEYSERCKYKLKHAREKEGTKRMRSSQHRGSPLKTHPFPSRAGRLNAECSGPETESKRGSGGTLVKETSDDQPRDSTAAFQKYA